MTSPVSPSETIEKAMEGVTPGTWGTRQMGKRLTRELDRLFVVGRSDIVHGLDGICEPDRLNDRNFAEDNANMRYIAACNPVAMREVLDELYALRETALKLEAMQREMAEKDNLRKVVNAVLTWAEQRCPCENDQPNPCPLCGASVENLEPCKSAENTIPRHLLADLRRASARTLIQGEKK